MRHGRQNGYRRHDEDDAQVIITRHAIERDQKRARPGVTLRRIERELSQRVLAAFDEGNVFRVDQATHLVPLVEACTRPVCAVIDLSGPVHKPFAITVCAVLTAEMAVITHGHLPGLISALSARLAA